MRPAWFLLLYAMIGIVALRHMLPVAGTLGHHWDWSLPPSAPFYQRMLSQSSQIWNPQYLGYSYVLSVSVLPTFALLGFLGSIGLSGEVISKALLVLVIGTSGYSAYGLLLEITRDPRNSQALHSSLAIHGGPFLAGYFYAFSPFLFNEIVGGAFTQFIAYALSPVAILTFVRTLNSRWGEWRGSLVTSIALSAIAISQQYSVLVFAIILLFAVSRWKKGLLTFGRVLFLWSILNCYWILPLAYSFPSYLSVATTQNPPASILLNLQIHVPTIIQAFVGTGYWTDFFTLSIASTFYPFWLISSISLVAASIAYALTRREASKAMLWVTVLVVSIIFETGYNSPLAPLVRWIFTNFSPMVLFKSPQHLIFPTILGLTAMLGLFSANILRRRTPRQRVGVFIILLLMVSIWVSPFFSGNFGRNVDVYQLPASYASINSIISHDSETGFRILYLPMSGSPRYLNDDFQGANQGGDPTIAYSQMPTIVSDLASNPQAKEFATAIEEMIGGSSPPSNAAKLLSLVNVKYIVLRNDVLPNFGPLVGNWNVTQVYENLIHLDGVKLVATYPEASLWENDVPRAPLIYAASNAIYDNPPIYAIRNWQSLSGQWTAFQQYSIVGVNGVLRTNSIFGDTDLFAQTQLLPNPNSFNDWVLWHGADAGNYYYAGQTGVGYFSVGKLVGGQRSEMFSEWMGYARNQTLWIRVDSRGSNFEIFSGADGEHWTLMYNFEDSTFPTGFVGLSAAGVGRLSNVAITDPNNNTLFRDDFSRSNLIQLILSNGFVVGQTVVISPNDAVQAPLDPDATATVTSGDETQHLVQIESRGPFYLVDGETFDPGWTFDAPQAMHIVANRWMNSWVIESEMSRRVSLLYSPQRLFQYGVIVSALTLTTFVAALICYSPLLRRVSHETLRSTTRLATSLRHANDHKVRPKTLHESPR